MDRAVELDELVEHWTLLDDELGFVSAKRGANRLGFALLLKFFIRHARFPRGRAELPDAVVAFVAEQVRVEASELGLYDWVGRTVKFHRAQYQAMIETGRAQKPLFVARYLRDRDLQREINEGLNVVEAWNRGTQVLFYGMGGDIATNRRDEQELSPMCLRVLQSALVYVNTLMAQDVLDDASGRTGSPTPTGAASAHCSEPTSLPTARCGST